MIKKKILLSLVGFLVLPIISLSSCSKKQAAAEQNTRPQVANSASIPTYVFYYAKWCGYCHKMAPAVKQASEIFKDKIFFYYVDIDSPEGQSFSSKYRPGGRGVPYGQFYDSKGNFVKDKIGLISFQELEGHLKSLN